MKKSLIFALVLTTVSTSLFSCGPSSSEPSVLPTDEPTSASVETPTINEEETNVKILKENDLKNENFNIIKWEGRYEYREKDSSLSSMMLLYHTATGFTIDFCGTELKTKFFHAKDFESTTAADIYYDVKVDDEILPNTYKRRFFLPKNETETTIDIVSGLKEGRHTVTVLKQSEPADAYTGVISIETDGYFYKRNEENDQNRMKILSVNASGGSGYGALSYNEQSENYHKRSTKYSSSLHSFNYLTARVFDSDISYCAQAGWGVKYSTKKSILDVIDKCGITPSNNVSGALTTGDWDPNLYIPDVILFNIGGNDTGNNDFDVEIYKSGVIELVNKLHDYYPEAKMLWTHTMSKAGTYAVTALQDNGIIKQGYIKQCVIPAVGEGETGNGTYGAANHASLKTHIDASNKIIETLTRWGYKTVREQIKFSDFEDIIQK